MTTPSPLDLAAGFDPPSLDAWAAKVAADLKGRTPDTLAWTTEDGVALPVLCTEGAGAAPPARQPGWRTRAPVARPTPLAAAAAVRAAVDAGADEVELRLDRLGRAGRDPGAEGAAAGDDGLSLASAEELEAVLAPLDLTRTTVAFDAGAATPVVLGFLREVARRRGVDGDALRVDAGLTPVDGLAAARDADLAAARAATEAAHGAPGVRVLRASGVPAHERGATAAQEIAATLGAAAALLRAGFAADTLTLRATAGTELLTEVAKLRALRRGFAKVAAAFGVSDTVPLVVETSRRALARQHDPRTNLLRNALAATAAVCGGCDALLVVPDELDVDRQTQPERRHALHQHTLLRAETLLDQVDDPLGGAFAVEQLTWDIGAAAWALLQEIEAAGGLDTAAGAALLAARVAAAGGEREQRVRRRERVRIGLSRYADPALEGDRAPTLAVDAQAARQSARAAAAAAAGDDSLGARAAAADLARPVAAPARGDAHAFEQLRDTVPPRRAALVLVGDARPARARADLARDVLGLARCLAHEVEDDRLTGTDLVVLCGDDASTAAALDEWRAKAEALQPSPKLVDAARLVRGDVVATLQELLA